MGDVRGAILFWAFLTLSLRPKSKTRAHVLRLKCLGIDTTIVKDDNGGLAKTVSVENSFRRGTVKTREAVMDAARDVCRRLPDLLDERASISRNPSMAYATTIRLTVRLVVKDMSESEMASRGRRRRPFQTFSKQSSFQGKSMLTLKEDEKPSFLFQNILPLLQSLVLGNSSMDVTRLNLAVTNFCDLDCQTAMTSSTRSDSSPGMQQSIISQARASPVEASPENVRKPRSQNTPSSCSRRSKNLHEPDEANLRASDIDPAVLEELPAHIRAQIQQNFPAAEPMLSPLAKRSRKKKTRRIDDFFSTKKAKTTR